MSVTRSYKLYFLCSYLDAHMCVTMLTFCLYMCIPFLLFWLEGESYLLYCSKYSHLLSRSFQIHKTRCVCAAVRTCIVQRKHWKKLNEYDRKDRAWYVVVYTFFDSLLFVFNNFFSIFFVNFGEWWVVNRIFSKVYVDFFPNFLIDDHLCKHDEEYFFWRWQWWWSWLHFHNGSLCHLIFISLKCLVSSIWSYTMWWWTLCIAQVFLVFSFVLSNRCFKN